jgi:hypothetical protein
VGEEEKGRYEILDMGPKDIDWSKDPERNNHCILRLTFLHPLEASDAGLRTRKYSSLAHQYMNLAVVPYLPSPGQLPWCVKLRMGGDRTVGDAVRIIRNTHLVPCHFDTPNEQLVASTSDAGLRTRKYSSLAHQYMNLAVVPYLPSPGLRIIRNTHLVPCHFDTPNEQLVGCRDFL